MKTRLLLCSLVLILLTACGADETPSPTPEMSAGNAAVELIQQDMYIRLTQQSIEAQRIETGAKMTATQQVLDATATQRVHSENIQMTRAAAAQTQQVWEVTVAAAQARDAATQQAAMAQGTEKAQMQATASQMAVIGLTATVEFRGTATADNKTQQAPLLAAQQRAMDAQAQSMETKLRQEQATWFFWAWALPVLLIVAVIGAGFMLWKKSQVGTIAPDQRGNYPLVMTIVNGEKRMTFPALMPSPVLEFGKTSTRMPMLADPETQRQTTHGAQIVQALGALQPGYQRQALGLAGGLSAPQGAVNIQVVQPGNVQGWLDDVQGQLSARVEEE